MRTGTKSGIEPVELAKERLAAVAQVSPSSEISKAAIWRAKRACFYTLLQYAEIDNVAREAYSAMLERAYGEASR